MIQNLLKVDEQSLLPPEYYAILTYDITMGYTYIATPQR